MTMTKGRTKKEQARSGAPDWVADAFRRWGYLQAELDPLGRLQPLVHPDIEDAEASADASADASARSDAVARWRSIYCGSIGVEYMHMLDRERVRWMTSRLEGEQQEPDPHWVLERLAATELFEKFLHSRYVGSKRFSIDGVAGMIVLLDAILSRAAVGGAQFLYIAMSHRGRVNVMKNIVNIPTADLFTGMEDVDPRSVLGSGDVKYHLGATGTYTTESGKTVDVHLSTNPSHLEAVTAVVMGRTRARQERWGEGGTDAMLPITMHGDAAFAGQGITSETLNFADLPDYSVGGTVHVIVNNLVGFTAEPASLHSTRYASDAAKRLAIPIIHVNGEDPSALWRAGQIAVEYRYRFKSDVVIDLIGYRRYGHSEVEDPTTTQPLLYQKIKARPMLWEMYGRQIGESTASMDKLRERTLAELSEEQKRGREKSRRPLFFKLPQFWGRYQGGRYLHTYEVDTAVDHARLTEITDKITTVPPDFHPHAKIQRMFERGREMTAGKRMVDWGMAEALAFGSLLWDGARVRLCGQDSRRGTFNHRHATLVDIKDNQKYVPLQNLHDEQGAFTVVDSPLSEAAALGFEYGFSREFPDGLILWEAQFGDFANGAQIIIDQFVSAAEDKWQLLSGIVLLLPHGYEGQGPEHSSARLERFLQLGGEDNIQVCQPSSAAQHFHMLRRQNLRCWRKPLVVFTPKSMLRSPAAGSDIHELTQGQFHEVIGDDVASNARTVLLCSGKIVHELRAERVRRKAYDVAIVAVEQLYPFPKHNLSLELARHQHAHKLVWVQEEPANMGALSYIRPRLQQIVGDRHITTIKRSESASPATGSAKAHALEQDALTKLAFA